jgi:hypothetical protein
MIQISSNGAQVIAGGTQQNYLSEVQLHIINDGFRTLYQYHSIILGTKRQVVIDNDDKNVIRTIDLVAFVDDSLSHHF